MKETNMYENMKAVRKTLEKTKLEMKQNIKVTEISGKKNKWLTFQIDIKTLKAPHFIDITDYVKNIVLKSKIKDGHVSVFSRHTTTAVRIQENEPRLLNDFVGFLESVAPEKYPYNHNDLEARSQSPDGNMTEDESLNGHSHCRHLLMGSSETIPVINGKMCLGIWQRIFAIELDRPRERSIIVQVLGY